jgi:glycosyltransferase involved in cell wall biosynthesis
MIKDFVLATPTYNASEYLSVFLESCSIFAKEYPIVVVDDGSTDDTKEVLNRYYSKLNKLTIYLP